MVLKAAEEFGRDEEVLATAAAVFACGSTGDVDQARMNKAESILVSDVHSGQFGGMQMETDRSLRGSMPWLISSTSRKGALARLCRAMR